ncbi:threonine synthase [Pinisolibacter aquiterrae]|uniref:threonine synthase n=1 Tax=Pinisolibacter aquiterrae TaxID=2815579 RepID=UPI001C3E4DBD|nr:threonine synthase [Pinisolibacter aquiterrae]MCC8234998.1 threonine synthase [Pinisolibacter aquiterrae]
MRYVSTRGEAPGLGFSDVLLAGLARDGGLYVPESWPTMTADEIADLAGKPYPEVAFRVISRFTGDDLAPDVLRAMIDGAYASFRHPAVTPLTQLAANHFLLELSHGPTLAFKDVAMQFLGRVMDHVLAQRGERATIVGATSGDTGGAAIEAFKGRERVDVFIMYPHGRVSDVQRRQMTTVNDPNVHAIALQGTFDDAQGILKGMFNHFSFRDRIRLTGVNSINWARVVAQVVYYFYAACALGAPHRKVSFCVPTGNFGDIFAGFVAKKLGLPIEKLVIATNVNDILHRTLETGAYELRDVVPSQSPSMDIQVSSNFERLLFEAMGRDGEAVAGLMSSLSQGRSFTVPEEALAAIRADFASGRADEAETAATIARVRAETGETIDPHTAVAVSVAERFLGDEVPMITLSTAHPAKFPDAVEAATGVRPGLPVWLGDLMEREERFEVVANDLVAVERFVEERSRAVHI